jgi:hypothetical protein
VQVKIKDLAVSIELKLPAPAANILLALCGECSAVSELFTNPFKV